MSETTGGVMKTTQVIAIIGALLSVVILPAAVWLFTTTMGTRDDVQQMKADICAIKEVFISEIADLRGENEILKAKIYLATDTSPSAGRYVIERGLMENE